MALTQVRARLGGAWVNLTYNPATGRYEGYLDPAGTSIHEPGGYYSVAVKAINAEGETVSASGEQLPALRLVVRETAAPTLTLVSPTPGYLTTQTPAFVVDAVDEDGGSGIQLGSFSASLPGTAAYEAIDCGYRFTWTPAEPWGEGGHTVTFTVRDRDGNESTVSAAYTVDTVPPVLYIRRPYLRNVVDDETVEIVAEVSDVSGVAVTIRGEPVQEAGGRFALTVPLQVGENHIPVIAVDGAGNETAGEVYMIRLVTDRAKADVDALLALYERPVAQWTPEELAWFHGAIQRGAYNAEDLNRVGTAVRYLAGELERRGYIAAVDTKTDWTDADAPVRSQMETYLANVETVRSAQGLYMPDIPASMRKLGVEGANQIEAALVAVDAVFPHYSAWTAGEITCGGV